MATNPPLTSSPLAGEEAGEGAPRRGSFQEALRLLQEETSFLTPPYPPRGSALGVRSLKDLFLVLSLLEDTTVSANPLVAVTFKALLHHYGSATFDEVPTERNEEGSLLLQEGALEAWAATHQEVFQDHEDLLPLFEGLVEEHLAHRRWGLPLPSEELQKEEVLKEGATSGPLPS